MIFGKKKRYWAKLYLSPSSEKTLLSPDRLREKISFEMICHNRFFLFLLNLKTEASVVSKVYKSIIHIGWAM
jgi:hypothetical protein